MSTTLRRIVVSAFLSAIFGLVQPAFAEEKKVTLEFDKNFICCIVNHDIIAEKLEKIDGINTVHFSLKKRRVLAYYDPSIIKVASIVDKLSKITKVDSKFIAAEVK